MSNEINLNELQSAYEKVTFGRDQPSEMYMPLSGLRDMSIKLKVAVRADITTFLELSKDLPADTPIVITLTEVGVLDLGTVDADDE